MTTHDLGIAGLAFVVACAPLAAIGLVWLAVTIGLREL